MLAPPRVPGFVGGFCGYTLCPAAVSVPILSLSPPLGTQISRNDLRNNMNSATMGSDGGSPSRSVEIGSNADGGFAMKGFAFLGRVGSFAIVSVFASWVVPSSQGFANVIDFQDAAQDQEALIHQYTFDGKDPAERREDRRGVEHLNEQAGGGATVEDIEYGVEGFDESSEAVKTFRPIPVTDEFGGGANFRIAQVALGNAFSYEIIFRPDIAVIEGGNFNLGYLLANRIENSRGYFLFQGSAEQNKFGDFGQDGDDLASVIGSGFNVSNENSILEEVQVGHWYYVAGSYQVNDDGTTEFTNYIADLTEGQDSLDVAGPVTVPGTYGTAPTGLSVGGRFDGQGEGFPGAIDEVNLYSEVIDEDVFQEHLEIILGEIDIEPKTMFHRGDPNNSGALDLSDGLFIFNFLFTGGAPTTCRESADGNGDQNVDLSDGVYLLNFLFTGGPPVVAPGGPDQPCGELAEDSTLGCEEYSHCN